MVNVAYMLVIIQSLILWGRGRKQAKECILSSSSIVLFLCIIFTLN